MSGVTITDALHDAQNGDVENLSKSVMTVEGTNGTDTIVASPETTGSIVFHGGAGIDHLTGGAGNDTFKYVVGDGADTIDGGVGSNTLDYTGTASAVSVDLGAGTATGFGGGGFTNIQNVVGGSAGDTLTGDAGANKFTGGGGNDTLIGGGGNDTAVYATSLALADLNYNGASGWTVNGGASGGTDTVKGIEFIEFVQQNNQPGRFVLIDGAGDNGFVDVQAAVAAGAGTQPGDTFVFAAPPAPTVPIVVSLTTSQNLDFTIPYDNPTTVTITGTGTAHVSTGDGADFVVTGSGADTIHTGGGNDVVDAAAVACTRFG